MTAALAAARARARAAHLRWHAAHTSRVCQRLAATALSTRPVLVSLGCVDDAGM